MSLLYISQFWIVRYKLAGKTKTELGDVNLEFRGIVRKKFWVYISQTMLTIFLELRNLAILNSQNCDM